MIGYAVLGFGMGIFWLIVDCQYRLRDVIDIRFRKDTVVLEGEVIDFSQIRNMRMTGYLTCPVISFSYNGISKMEIAATGNARYFYVNKYKLNQRVLVCFNPTLFEKKIIIKNDYNDISGAVESLLVAFAFLGIGIAATYYGIKLDIFI